MLWLSTKRSKCHFKCATFPLPWVHSLHCPSKNFFLFFDANSLDRQHSERAHGKRKVAQLKQFFSLDSQSILLWLFKERRAILVFYNFEVPFVTEISLAKTKWFNFKRFDHFFSL